MLRVTGVVDVSVWKSLPDSFFDARFLFGPQQPPVYAALHCIQQLQPILQRWFFNRLPLIVPAFAGKESPVASHMLRVNLQMDSFLRYPFPANLCFRHLCVNFRL